MRHPFIIIEGPDGSGKTTLAEAFVAEGYGYQKFGPPEYEPVDYYLDAIRKKAREGRPIVLDRAHPSSFVYGVIFRGMDDLSPFDHWTIDGTLMAHNSILLYARTEDKASTDAVLDSRPPRDEDARTFEVPEARDAVRALYDMYMQQMASLPMLWYDFTAEGMFERIVADAKGMVDHFGSIPDPFDGVECFGNRYSPGICFAGANPTEFLYRALSAAGAGKPVDDRPTLNKICIVERLPHDFRPPETWTTTHFVSLSDEAHHDLNRLGLRHSVLPGPDLVQRTRYKDVSRYGRSLVGDEHWEDFPALARRGFRLV
jgi:hypothetical protein